MPFRAPSICGCGRIVPPGQRCACKAVTDRERRAANDARRPNASTRGYDREWQRYRMAFLAFNPSCKMCGAPATVVDHIIPHRGDDRLFRDPNNHQPICTHCHCSTKQSQEKGTRR